MDYRLVYKASPANTAGILSGSLKAPGIAGPESYVEMSAAQMHIYAHIRDLN